jgi:hypothetical protein
VGVVYMGRAWSRDLSEEFVRFFSDEDGGANPARGVG